MRGHEVQGDVQQRDRELRGAHTRPSVFWASRAWVMLTLMLNSKQRIKKAEFPKKVLTIAKNEVINIQNNSVWGFSSLLQEISMEVLRTPLGMPIFQNRCPDLRPSSDWFCFPADPAPRRLECQPRGSSGSCSQHLAIAWGSLSYYAHLEIVQMIGSSLFFSLCLSNQ